MKLTLTEGRISRALIRFSLPFLLGSMIQMAYSFVDVLFLGWFASPSSLAGAGNGLNLVMTAMSLFMGLTSGGMILLGQYFGAENDERSAETTGNIIILQVIIVAVMTAVILLLGQTLIRLINVPSELDNKGLRASEEAWRYMSVCAMGLAFQAGYNTISSILRALGNSKTPMIFVAVSCGMNIVLDYLFVGIFQWGASGAAAATVIAQAFSFAVSLSYICRKKLPFKFSRRDIRPRRNTLFSILKLGVPISLQVVLNTVSFMAIARIINGMGVFASSANGVVNSIVNLYMIIPYSLGSALSTFSAQNLGAGKADRSLSATKMGVLFSLVPAVPALLAANLFPETIASVVSPDAGVIRASADFLISFSWDFLFVSFVFCINGLFNGCGITTFVAIHETVAALAVRIPVTWLCSRIPDATMFHIGIGTPAATLASLAMCLIYYRLKLSRGRIKNLRVFGA